MNREPNNLDRAAWADEALQTFAGLTSDIPNLRSEPGEVLGDLLCDLRHWAATKGIPFAYFNDRGHEHYLAEIEEGKS